MSPGLGGVFQPLKKGHFREEKTFFRTRFGQNQGLWSQNGDTMSPGLGGVFQLVKKVAWGIVPGLTLLLFSSPKRSNS
jgi:hypothetical protein